MNIQKISRASGSADFLYIKNAALKRYTFGELRFSVIMITKNRQNSNILYQILAKNMRISFKIPFFTAKMV